MNIRGNYRLRSYGVRDFGEFKGNKESDLLVMRYGEYKKFTFHKKNSYKLVESILGKEYLSKIGLDEKIFDNFIRKHGYIDTLNPLLKGKGFILVSTSPENLKENEKVKIGITNIDENGELLAEDDSEMFIDDVKYSEIFKKLYDKNITSEEAERI